MGGTGKLSGLPVVLALATLAQIDWNQSMSQNQPRTDVELEEKTIQGWIPALASDAEIREALEKAFDYRGDVTITRKDGSKVEGYLFDRRSGTSLTDSFVRVIPANEKTKVNVSYSDIAALAFTGRD